MSYKNPLKLIKDSLEIGGHFTAFDSEAQKDYWFKDSLAYQEAMVAIKALETATPGYVGDCKRRERLDAYVCAALTGYCSRQVPWDLKEIATSAARLARHAVAELDRLEKEGG